MNLRLLAARVIDEVTNGHSLSDALERVLPSIPDSRDRALLQAICYGVCRYYPRLDILLSLLLSKPMKAKDSDVHALLLVGLYQLMEMRIPEYAAVTETVNAVDDLQKPWAKALVNAVLRNYLRQKEDMTEKLNQEEESVYAHPLWLIAAIKKAWPNVWETILTANNAHPPFSLRVNQRRVSRENYLTRLKEGGQRAEVIAETETGLMLDEPTQAEALPGFAEGDVSVQDGAAQLAANLLDLKPNQRILDACAAPGGKLTHILEKESQLAAVIAVEKDPNRMQSIQDNLKRLQLQATTIVADVSEPEKWWDGKLFDRILLDVPCSASGVIRRHPDIKLLRQASDIKPFAKTQLHLLKTLWPLLKPDGLLVYATCSIFPEENEQVIAQFLQQEASAKEEKMKTDWGVTSDCGRQILPGMHHMDGFYYACLRKTTSKLTS